MSKLKSKYRTSWFFSGCLLLIYLFTGLSCKNIEKNKQAYRILLIHSYSKGPVWQDELTEGITNYFSENSINVSFDTYYMNTDFVSNAENIQRITELLSRYEQNPPDLIITFNNQATYSILSSKHPLAYSVPVVFSGVSHYLKEIVSKHTNATGFTSKPDFLKVFKLAGSLLKKDKTLTLAVDGTPAGLRMLNTFVDQMEGSRDSVNIEFYNLYEANIKDIMVWKTYYSQNAYVVMPKWNSFYSNLAPETNSPFFLVNNQGFGDGSIGGYMVPLNKEAILTAKTAIKVLKGKAIKDIPVTALEQVPVFDWRELQRWNLNVHSLPPNTLIAHMPFYVRYKIPLQTGGSILVIFIIVVLIQLTLLYKEEAKQKKEALDKLLKQGKELELTLKSIPEGVISLDLANNILTINKSALSFLGINGDSNSYIGTNLSSIMDIQLPGNNMYLHEMILSTKGKDRNTTFDETAFIVSPSKKNFPIKGDIAGIYRDGIAYGTVITFIDISTELILNELMRIAMSSGHIFPFYVHNDLEKIHCDDSFFSYYGIQNDEDNFLSNEHLKQLIHPDDLQSFVETYHQKINSNTRKFSLRTRLNLKEKGYNWFEFRLSSLFDPLSYLKKYYFGITMDIQPFKQIEEELVAAREKAEQSDKLKSAFLANMSHEIRTPLNAIVGFSNLLTSEEAFEAEERQMFIDAINNNCRVLLALITDILDLARIESGLMLFKDKSCDVNELIDQIINTQQVIIPSSLKLIKEVPKETITIQTDCIRLNQVLTNLVNNAVKFTPEGYIKVGYTVENENYLNFYVEDTGRGIAEEDIQNVFGRFYKKNEFTQGVGLGLSICKVIVDRFRGTINVKSEVGVGTRFDVRIPYKLAPYINADIISINSQTEDMEHTSSILHDKKANRPTILVAEDEDSNYLLVKAILNKEYNLLWAKNGREAVSIFEKQDIDLILMDIKMPIMTGIEALTEIRQESKSIPVVMLSAYVFDSDIEIARRAGASDYLSKPVSVKQLKDTLNKYLS